MRIKARKRENLADRTIAKARLAMTDIKLVCNNLNIFFEITIFFHFVIMIFCENLILRIKGQFAKHYGRKNSHNF